MRARVNAAVRIAGRLSVDEGAGEAHGPRSGHLSIDEGTAEYHCLKPFRGFPLLLFSGGLTDLCPRVPEGQSLETAPSPDVMP